MKREEFWLGLCLFALILVSGFSAPILKEMQKLHWDSPLFPAARFWLAPARMSKTIRGKFWTAPRG